MKSGQGNSIIKQQREALVPVTNSRNRRGEPRPSLMIVVTIVILIALILHVTLLCSTHWVVTQQGRVDLWEECIYTNHTIFQSEATKRIWVCIPIKDGPAFYMAILMVLSVVCMLSSSILVSFSLVCVRNRRTIPTVLVLPTTILSFISLFVSILIRLTTSVSKYHGGMAHYGWGFYFTLAVLITDLGIIVIIVFSIKRSMKEPYYQANFNSNL